MLPLVVSSPEPVDPSPRAGSGDLGRLTYALLTFPQRVAKIAITKPISRYAALLGNGLMSFIEMTGATLDRIVADDELHAAGTEMAQAIEYYYRCCDVRRHCQMRDERAS